MSEYLHVEKPFLDQLGPLGWTITLIYESQSRGKREVSSYESRDPRPRLTAEWEGE